MWEINKTEFSVSSPIFIEGLPGIGNVGKIAIDYIIEKLDAKRIASFFSTSLPNSVFVTENNLVSLPLIEVYHAKLKGKDFLFLTGDTQPSDEQASYELCYTLLDFCKECGVQEIVTTGGIGLESVPKNPVVFVTGNTTEFCSSFDANSEIYGVVGPIVGVSGLLLGLASVPAAGLLVQTYAHPVYVGLQEAKELLLVLEKKYGISISHDELDEEISQVRQKKKSKLQSKYSTDTQYIG